MRSLGHASVEPGHITTSDGDESTDAGEASTSTGARFTLTSSFSPEAGRSPAPSAFHGARRLLRTRVGINVSALFPASCVRVPRRHILLTLIREKFTFACALVTFLLKSFLCIADQEDGM